jgi:sugar phosphate isomerase/epimerase
VVAAQTTRFPLFHAKDGSIDTAVPNGYETVTFGTGDIDYTTFFQRIGALGYHNAMYEQDNAASYPAPSPSLVNAATSYSGLAALHG